MQSRFAWKNENSSVWKSIPTPPRPSLRSLPIPPSCLVVSPWPMGYRRYAELFHLDKRKWKLWRENFFREKEVYVCRLIPLSPECVNFFDPLRLEPRLIISVREWSFECPSARVLDFVLRRKNTCACTYMQNKVYRGIYTG